MSVKYEQSKKAQAEWTSWVLIILMVVVVGTLAGRYMIDKAQTNAQQLEEYSLNEEECVNVGLSIDYVCKNSKDLNMIISNNGNIRVEKVLFRLYDTSGNSEVREFDLSLKPEQTEELIVPRGRIGYEVEAIPIIKVESQIIECRDKSMKESDIPDC